MIRKVTRDGRVVSFEQHAAEKVAEHRAYLRARSFYGTARWKRQRAATIAAQPWCSDCGTDGSEPRNPLSADHVVPISLGGDPFGATVTRCVRCNTRRGGANRVRDWPDGA